MAKYILDTDVISYLWDKTSRYHDKVVGKLNSLDDGDMVMISIISIYELRYGTESFKDKNLKAIFEQAVESLVCDQDIEIASLNVKGAEHFSQLKIKYRLSTGITSNSAKKNDMDLLIASIAMSYVMPCWSVMMQYFIK